MRRQGLEEIVPAGAGGNKRNAVHGGGSARSRLFGKDGGLASEQGRPGTGHEDALPVGVNMERRPRIGRDLAHRKLQLRPVKQGRLAGLGRAQNEEERRLGEIDAGLIQRPLRLLPGLGDVRKLFLFCLGPQQAQQPQADDHQEIGQRPKDGQPPIAQFLEGRPDPAIGDDIFVDEPQAHECGRKQDEPQRPEQAGPVLRQAPGPPHERQDQGPDARAERPKGRGQSFEEGQHGRELVYCLRKRFVMKIVRTGIRTRMATATRSTMRSNRSRP